MAPNAEAVPEAAEQTEESDMVQRLRAQIALQAEEKRKQEEKAAATGRGDKTAACTARRCALLTPVTSVVVDALTKRTIGVSTSV